MMITGIVLAAIFILALVFEAWWFNEKSDDSIQHFVQPAARDPLAPFLTEWVQVANVRAKLHPDWQVVLTLRRNTDVHIALLDANLEQRAWGYNASAIEAMEWILEQINEVNQIQ